MGWLRRKQANPGSAIAQPQPGDALRPAPSDYPELIPGAGAAIATRNVMAGQGSIRFLTRVEPQDGVPDNGWRVFGEFDADEHVADTDNLVVVDDNQLCALEPALIGVWDFPVGADLEIVRDDRIRIIDVRGNQEIPAEMFSVPEPFRQD